MSWISFRERYLYHFNFTILVWVILYSFVAGKYDYLSVLLVFTIGIISENFRSFEKTIIKTLGRINSYLLLLAIYYIVFVPFSVAYRLYFAHKSFHKDGGRFCDKEKISSFDNPY